MSTLGTITLTTDLRDADHKRICDALVHTQLHQTMKWNCLVHDRIQTSTVTNRFLSGCANESQLEAIVALSNWTPIVLDDKVLPYWTGITAYKCTQHLGSTNYLNLRFQVADDIRTQLPVRLKITPHTNQSGTPGMLVTGAVSSTYIERAKAPMTMITTLLLKQDGGGEYIEDILLGDATAHSRIWVPSILSKNNDNCPAENALSLGLETVTID